MRAAQSQLLIIDVQEKLLPVMAEPEQVERANLTLIAAARHMDVPISFTEQYPKGIGHTAASLRLLAGDDARFFEKMHFSALQEPEIRAYLNKARLQIVLAGIESHICLLQSAFDLLGEGFAVYCVDEAMSSRTPASKNLALARLRAAGASIVSVEMVLFEWLERAGTPAFKAMLPLIK